MFTAQDIRNDLIIGEIRQNFIRGLMMKRLATILVAASLIIAGLAIVLAASIPPAY